MTKPENPTLSDIYTALGRQDEKLEQIHSQVKATNGRVTKLEGWKRDVDAVTLYQEKHPVATPQEEKGKWTAREKTLTAIIISLIALASAAISTGSL